MSHCRNCGGPFNLVGVRCEYCGSEISTLNAVSYDVFLAQFSKELAEALSRDSDAETENRDMTFAANKIGMIFVPADKQDLMKLGMFVSGQATTWATTLTMYNISAKGAIASAWVGKAQEIVLKSQILGLTDPQLLLLSNQLDKDAGNLKSSIALNRKKYSQFYISLGIGLVLLFAVIGFVIWFIATFH